MGHELIPTAAEPRFSGPCQHKHFDPAVFPRHTFHALVSHSVLIASDKMATQKATAPAKADEYTTGVIMLALVTPTITAWQLVFAMRYTGFEVFTLVY